MLFDNVVLRLCMHVYMYIHKHIHAPHFICTNQNHHMGDSSAIIFKYENVILPGKPKVHTTL